MAEDTVLRVTVSIKRGYDNLATQELTVPADASATDVGETVADVVTGLRSQIERFRPREDGIESESKVTPLK